MALTLRTETCKCTQTYLAVPRYLKSYRTPQQSEVTWGDSSRKAGSKEVFKKSMFSDIFESKLADLENYVMQNTDMLIKKKSQPKQLPVQESLKSLPSTTVWMFVNKRAVSQSLLRALSALHIGQEITLHIQSFGAICPQETKPCIAAQSQNHGTAIVQSYGTNFLHQVFST